MLERLPTSNAILATSMIKQTINEPELLAFGEQLGRKLKGGEVIELIGDVGAGKTTLTRGIARGLEVDDDIQSPTFTISRVYGAGRGLQLVHYDFYRLTDAGIMAMELDETIDNDNTVTVIEWGDVVAGVLPKDRLTVAIAVVGEATRSINISANGDRSSVLKGELT